MAQIPGEEGAAPEDGGGARPRILFLIDEIGGIAEGGTERQILQLIELAHRLEYEPRLAALRGTEWLSEAEAGCPVYSAGVHSLGRPAGWQAALKLADWMRRERIALVQTFFVESNILGPWLARLAGVPVVIGSRRNLNQWQGRTKWIGPAVRGLQRLANFSTDCIVANSMVAAEAASEMERVPREKLHVAYNGIELERFANLKPLRAEARRGLGVTEDEILTGNISCMRGVKGIPLFVEAAKLAAEVDPKLRFVVVGDGEERSRVEEMIRQYGLEGRVHLAGAQADVLPYLAAMDVGVLSSLAEGFSNSLLEYMASGLAAVATDVGGNREALEGAGILVPAKDAKALAEAILELRSAGKRQEMGRAARERVERFSLARAQKRMAEIYGSYLNGNGRLLASV